MNFIFDFDGTLIDSFRSAIEKFNLLAEEFNYRKVREDEVEGLRSATSIELIKYFKIPLYKIPRVLLKARKLMRADMQTLLPFVNLKAVLQKLHDSKIELGILTSNSSENVMAWLKRNDMQHLFSFVHGESSFFGKSHALKKIIKSHALNKDATFYIGDETRDIEAAKASKVRSIAVGWGFNSQEILTQYQPNYLAKIPEDLLLLMK